jgi:hypothetical protein
LTELSIAVAAGVVPRSFIAVMEERLDLRPGELYSGAFPIMQSTRTSTQAELTIFHPRRERFVSAVIDFLGSEDFAAIANALRILKSWEPAGPEDNK